MGQTDTDKPSDIMTIQLIILNGYNIPLSEFGHSLTHPLGDIGNDFLVSDKDLK